MSLDTFLTSDSNTFNFSLKETSDTHINLLIDGEFEFRISLPDLVVSSQDDFLMDWSQEVNSTKHENLETLLNTCTKSYGKLMGLDENEDSPLYKGQEVFELENDNHDIKFISRVRISEEYFNQDLLVNCFAFLAPQNTANLMRVSKRWYKLIQKDALWKQYCFNLFHISDLTHDSWMQEFVDNFSSMITPRFVKKWMPSNVKFNTKEPRNLKVTDGVYVLTKSNHLTFRLDNDKLKGSIQGGGFTSSFGTNWGSNSFVQGGFGGFGSSFGSTSVAHPNLGFGLIPKSLIPKDFDEITSNLSKEIRKLGYIFWCTGHLYSKTSNADLYSIPLLPPGPGGVMTGFGGFGSSVQTFGYISGQTVCVFYDPIKRTISYQIGGKDCGVAFYDVDDEELHPIIVCGMNVTTGRSHQVDISKTQDLQVNLLN